MNAAARGPGVLAVGAGGGGDGEASWENEVDGIAGLLTWAGYSCEVCGADGIDGGCIVCDAAIDP